MTYKPRTDEELARDTKYAESLLNRGSPYSFTGQTGALNLLEQARRANKLAEAVADLGSCCGLNECSCRYERETALYAALANYRGDK